MQVGETWKSLLSEVSGKLMGKHREHIGVLKTQINS